MWLLEIKFNICKMINVYVVSNIVVMCYSFVKMVEVKRILVFVVGFL